MKHQIIMAQKHIKILAWFILVNILTIHIHAQNGKLFNTSNNLSSSFATQVFESHNGFIWIATRNGLNLYDGYHFIVYHKDTKNLPGFSNNYINCINEDAQRNIILGTSNGIILYDGKQFKDLPMVQNGKSVKSFINNILCRKNGEVWVCTSGYGIMRINKSRTKCESINSGALASLNHIYRATEDCKGRVWIITEDLKLLRLEHNGKLTQHFMGIKDIKAKMIAEDKDGNIFLATEYQGVYEMRHGTSHFTKIEAINTNNIDCIYIDKHNQLYIGSNGGGLCIYNPHNNKVVEQPFFSNEVNLAKAKVNSIIEDRQGNIWFSMLQKGVFMQPSNKFDFEYMGSRLGSRNLIGDNCVTSILLSQKGQIWVGTDKDGLYSLSKTSPMTAHHYPNVPSSILALCEDLKGNIWLGSYREGLGCIDATGNYHNINLLKGTSVNVFDIQADLKGNLWFATMGHGLICLHPDGSIQKYQMVKGADNNIKINSLPNNYLAKLSFSKDYRKLYVTSAIGLSCLDIKNNCWTNTFDGRNCISKGTFAQCVLSDSKGNIWYGTEDGVFMYNLKDIEHPRHYSVANGLSSNCTAFITEDAKGKIWVGTAHGLNVINPQNGNIGVFYEENGLQSNEFSERAASAAFGGKLIAVGGTGGINWFYPQNIKPSKWKGQIIISNFVVGNTNVYPGMRSGSYTILEEPVAISDHFDLSHNDNTFSLQLSTLTYNNVEQICYAYSINGDEWHTTQRGQNEISFSHLAPGTYHFVVKAINNGVEGAMKRFTIIIHPAWYASTWAKLLYLLTLIGLCCLYIRHRKKKEEDRMLLQKHIHAEEMGEAKLRFFMNISHEIRTPLTLIITPLLSLIKDDKDPHRQSIYDIIRKNSERILHLINQMMDLRKIDKGQMMMRMSETDMVSFILDEYQLFKQQAIAKSIDFQFKHDDDKLPVWIDRNNFDKVLMNVLSNAFKFTPTGGKILITLTHTEHHAYISIKDNGIGIPKDKLETIFQRFYQSPTYANDRNIGTGIGLDLTRSLVELHYGTIVAHNNQDQKDTDFNHGSEFIIRLPLGCEHLKAEEMITDTPKDRLETFTKEEEEIAEIEPEETKPTNSTKASIALVEDEDEILEYLSSQLSKDFHIYTFHNGKEALHEIIKLRPDLVVSDIMMPEMNGTTLCAKLKSNLNTNHIPVILLTAMSREEDQLSGLQTGADAYIVKPFNMDILHRTILNLLSVRRTLRNKFTGQEGQEDKMPEIAKEQSPDELLLEKVMKVINENIDDTDLSVDMIAQKVGISRVHLYRKMKELTNQTPHNFIRNIRLKQAAKMLAQSNKNVTEVMWACGFNNAASFSTMFKNTYGCSPREYMNQAQQKNL